MRHYTVWAPGSASRAAGASRRAVVEESQRDVLEPPASRTRLAPFQRLAAVTLASSLVLVAVGGAVRATDSGLACPTWPGCFSAGDFVPAFQLNVWLEHSHRLIAGVVGLEIAALLVWALARYRRPRILVPTVIAAVAVNVQALLGALVVWHLLRAELVTAHLGMAMLIVACLAYLVMQADPRTAQAAETGVVRDRRFLRLAAVVAALCYAQILVGGHVTGISAGLVWTDFPLTGGQILPPVTTERELFHLGHRMLAYLLTAGVITLGVAAVRRHRVLAAAEQVDSSQRWLLRLPVAAVVLVLIQVALGVGNLVTRTSAGTVIPHLAVASWLWTVLVFTVLIARRGSAVPATQPEAVEAARAEVVG